MESSKDEFKICEVQMEGGGGDVCGGNIVLM